VQFGSGVGERREQCLEDREPLSSPTAVRRMGDTTMTMMNNGDESWCALLKVCPANRMFFKRCIVADQE
jgi:hypothetical protein